MTRCYFTPVKVKVLIPTCAVTARLPVTRGAGGGGEGRRGGEAVGSAPCTRAPHARSGREGCAAPRLEGSAVCPPAFLRRFSGQAAMMARGAKVTGPGASRCPAMRGQALAPAWSQSVQPGPAPQGRLLLPGQRGVPAPAPSASWAGESLGACLVPRSGDSCTPRLRPAAGSTPMCPDVAGGEGQDASAVLGGRAAVTRTVGAARGPVRGRPRSQPPEGRHRGTAGLGTVEAGDGEQWAAGRWAEAEDGHRAWVEGPSLKEARRPSSTRVGPAFRAAGRVGCLHCARGPEHRPTPDAASATAHDGAAGSGGRGPLSAPPSPVTADSASWAGFAGGHEAPLVRAGSALGPTRSRVQDRKLGPGGPEGHGHRFTFASSGLSAGSCRRGTQARGAASWAGRPVL